VSNEIERVALRAARAAGKIHLKRLSRITIARKSSAIDLVTEADREAEAAVIATIHRAFPDHAVLAEESGATAHRSEHRWIVDPLDGTTNFAHGFPQFCVSIACERHGKVQTAIVYDALKRECFTATRGRGARLNGKLIRVSTQNRLSGALLSTGFPYDARERRHYYLRFWEEFMATVQGIRRTGAAALDIAYVAAGRVDAMWEFGLKPWDVAAAALILEESHGRISNMDGSPLDLAGGNVIGSNARLHSQMMKVVARARAAADRIEAKGNSGRTRIKSR